MTFSPRILTPYEQNQLRRFGKQDVSLEEIGQKPIEYITGKVEFYGRVFSVSQDVLIPRVETEELVNLALSKLKSKKEKLVLADVGTGSGAIGITLLLELRAKKQQVEIFLSDVSPTAIKIAQKNIDTLAPKLKSNASVFKSDLLASFPHKKFDLMVANLPYIPSQRIEYLEESVKDFEPKVALDGGKEGLDLIHQFLKQAVSFLKPDGVILLEIDHTHTAEELLPPEVNGQVSIIEDSFGQKRFAEITFN